MEISSSLLVAIMFVVLITMGIGNILMSLASMVDRRSPLTASRLHLSWILLLLLAIQKASGQKDERVSGNVV